MSLSVPPPLLPPPTPFHLHAPELQLHLQLTSIFASIFSCSSSRSSFALVMLPPLSTIEVRRIPQLRPSRTQTRQRPPRRHYVRLRPFSHGDIKRRRPPRRQPPPASPASITRACIHSCAGVQLADAPIEDVPRDGVHSAWDVHLVRSGHPLWRLPHRRSPHPLHGRPRISVPLQSCPLPSPAQRTNARYEKRWRLPPPA